MMTYEEYLQTVKKEFHKFWPQLSDEEVEEYFQKEGEAITRERYAHDSEKYKNGEITKAQLEIGSVSSVAYCLQLMY